MSDPVRVAMEFFRTLPLQAGPDTLQAHLDVPALPRGRRERPKGESTKPPYPFSVFNRDDH